MPQIGRYPENMTIAQTIQMIKDTRKVSESELDTELFRSFRTGKSIFDKKCARFLVEPPKSKCCFGFLFNPGIIILDEPTAGLDPLASEILKIKSSKKKQRKTHHYHLSPFEQLDDIVSEIVFMNEGKVIVHQSVEELMTERKPRKISESIISILKEMKP